VAAEAQAQTKFDISLLEYCARFDGVTNDAEAWKSAIKDELYGPWEAVIKFPAWRSVVSETLVVETTGNLFNFVPGNRAKKSWGMVADCDQALARQRSAAGSPVATSSALLPPSASTLSTMTI